MPTDPPFSSPDLVTVYGVDTCEDTTRARAYFDAAGLAYRYVNYDLDPAAKALVHTAGYTHTPVVALPDGSLFVEPTDAELAAIVASAGAVAAGRVTPAIGDRTEYLAAHPPVAPPAGTPSASEILIAMREDERY